MENKIKAVLLTILVLVVLSLITYGIMRNVQFIGFLLFSAIVIFMCVAIYQTIFSSLENKSKNNKNKQS